MTIKDAWDIIAKLRTPDAEGQKIEILTELLKAPFGEVWSDFLIHVKEKFAKSEEREKAFIPLYPGELRQIHGAQEAAGFIAKGKYKKTLDNDGDICYIKTQEKFVQRKKRETEVEADRSIIDHCT